MIFELFAWVAIQLLKKIIILGGVVGITFVCEDLLSNRKVKYFLKYILQRITYILYTGLIEVMQ